MANVANKKKKENIIKVGTCERVCHTQTHPHTPKHSHSKRNGKRKSNERQRNAGQVHLAACSRPSWHCLKHTQVHTHIHTHTHTRTHSCMVATWGLFFLAIKIRTWAKKKPTHRRQWRGGGVVGPKWLLHPLYLPLPHTAAIFKWPKRSRRYQLPLKFSVSVTVTVSVSAIIPATTEQLKPTTTAHVHVLAAFCCTPSAPGAGSIRGRLRERRELHVITNM